jgi:Gas vesicle synthesis protein GvpL/GvpF
MATTTETRGLYVYGVTLAEVPCAADTLDVGRLRAVVSEQPLDRYEPEAVDAAIREPGQLEEWLRDHEAVVQAVQDAGPVAPFRFGTIFRTEAELRSALARAEDALVARLEELRGASEWGVKAWVDDGVLRGWFEAHDEEARRARMELDATAEPGRRYLQEKKLRRLADAEAAGLALERAHAAHEELAAEAREATVDRPSGLDARTERRPLLRASYLVADDRLGPFEHLLEELQGRDAELGIEYTLSGPWPPYSFVDVELA